MNNTLLFCQYNLQLNRSNSGFFSFRSPTQFLSLSFWPTHAHLFPIWPSPLKLVSFPFHTNPIFPSPVNLSHWVPMLSPLFRPAHILPLFGSTLPLIRFLPLQPFVSFTYHLPASVAISTLPSTPLTPSVNQSLLTWIHLAFANSCHLPRYTGLAPLHHQSRWNVWAEPTVHFPPQMLPDPLSSSNSLFLCSRFHHLQSLGSTETTILESYYIWMW